jgi:crotonobetainyl-CoA:carnitine CoA-transferase CaiB-like acyl-CoA transferase
MVREVNDPQFGPVLHSGIVPHFPEDPGSIRWAGPVAGAHTDTVLRELIGMQPEEIDALRRAGGI